ncbi:hypothetical protein R1flu_020680 [Riccia fluitans]|uniref:Reverse transcriptase zinc-binding domain-containing protein n=1 Tax=Riccia fluitans TaxID=41844 RepID=A0ABD1ZNE1_9MARC
MELASSNDPSAAQTFRRLEEEVRETELLECSILRRRSRSDWAAKGETCSKYFFATLKTKQAAERMTTLLDDEGREVKEENKILNRIHSYYRNLCAQPATPLAEVREQTAALGLVDCCVTEEDNNRLMKIPGAVEVKGTVKNLPLGKSPGEDGLPVEVLHELWEETGEGCLQFIQEAWKSKRISRSLCNIIGKFEQMSGAQLNPAKSVILPFALEHPPNWLLEMGCQVLKPGQFITYLGCRFGVEKAEAERFSDIKDKIQRKLNKWANRFLSWSSRVLFLHHVLKALPVYHFLGLGLQKISYNKLESPCRTFLWGANADGLDEQSLILPGSLTLRQVQMLLTRYSSRKPFNERIVYPLLKRLGVSVLANLVTSYGDWLKIASALRSRGMQLNGLQLAEIGFFQQWIRTVQMGARSLEESPSWKWDGTEIKRNRWLQASTFWHRLLAKEETADDLSDKWPEGRYELSWATRWKKLWGEGGLTRTRLWTWRQLRRAFFTGERAATLKVAQGLCCQCQEALETTPHLFYECWHSATRWRQLQVWAAEARATFQLRRGLLENIDKALSGKKKDGTLFFIVYSLTNSIWKDRTQACFRNRLENTPLRISLDLARVEIEASFLGKSSNGRWQKGMAMLEQINQIIEIADRPAQRSAEETLNGTESSEANEQASELADRLALLSTEGPSNGNENSQSNESTSVVPTRNPP